MMNMRTLLMSVGAMVLIILLQIPVFAQMPQKTVVYFPFAKSYITTQAAETLDKALKDDKTIDSIKIYAYCDSVDNSAFNDSLSMQRVLSIKRYLVEKGVSASVFRELKGYGKRQPVNNNSTEKERAENRRAEVWIYGKPFSGIVVEGNVADSIHGKVIVQRPWAAILNEIKVGQSFTLKTLNFYPGRHQLIPKSKRVLDSLAILMQTHPALEIEIDGYVCCEPEGMDSYDDDNGQWGLSVNRARVVYDYLMAAGISSKRLSYKGFGSQPIVEELDEYNRELNRRVEIKVLKK